MWHLLINKYYIICEYKLAVGNVMAEAEQSIHFIFIKIYYACILQNVQHKWIILVDSFCSYQFISFIYSFRI